MVVILVVLLVLVIVVVVVVVVVEVVVVVVVVLLIVSVRVPCNAAINRNIFSLSLTIYKHRAYTVSFDVMAFVTFMNRSHFQDKGVANSRHTCECYFMWYAQSVAKLKNSIYYLLTFIYRALSVKARSTS